MFHLSLFLGVPVCLTASMERDNGKQYNGHHANEHRHQIVIEFNFHGILIGLVFGFILFLFSIIKSSPPGLVDEVVEADIKDRGAWGIQVPVLHECEKLPFNDVGVRQVRMKSIP